MAPYIKNTFSRRGLSRENVFGAALRLQGNESPGGAFKQASGLRQQAPDHPILWGVPETNYLKFFLFQVI